MRRTRAKPEAIRYLENARDLMRKSPIEEDRYEDIKYVQEACGTAYLAILKAIDEYLMKRGVSEKDLPHSVEGYREMIKTYLVAGYYRGLIEDVNALKEIFRSAKGFIGKLRRGRKAAVF